MAEQEQRRRPDRHRGSGQQKRQHRSDGRAERQEQDRQGDWYTNALGGKQVAGRLSIEVEVHRGRPRDPRREATRQPCASNCGPHVPSQHFRVVQPLHVRAEDDERGVPVTPEQIDPARAPVRLHGAASGDLLERRSQPVDPVAERRVVHRQVFVPDKDQEGEERAGRNPGADRTLDRRHRRTARHPVGSALDDALDPGAEGARHEEQAAPGEDDGSAMAEHPVPEARHHWHWRHWRLTGWPWQRSEGP